MEGVQAGVIARRHHRIPTAAAARISGMPTISRFFGIAIAMFFDDHGPPHFTLATLRAAERSGSTRSK
jgi:hypothetical protein